ncbi:hypothetical protein TcWFU_010379 [Taenia crassiceps]|uniref:Uncharacterized protein n=1 Tax=Taenia crassiceps TaxID=6207 RepID=A0ABR4Q9E4_9CEST
MLHAFTTLSPHQLYPTLPTVFQQDIHTHAHIRIHSSPSPSSSLPPFTPPSNLSPSLRHVSIRLQQQQQQPHQTIIYLVSNTEQSPTHCSPLMPFSSPSFLPASHTPSFPTSLPHYLTASRITHSTLNYCHLSHASGSLSNPSPSAHPVHPFISTLSNLRPPTSNHQPPAIYITALFPLTTGLPSDCESLPRAPRTHLSDIRLPLLYTPIPKPQVTSHKPHSPNLQHTLPPERHSAYTLLNKQTPQPPTNCHPPSPTIPPIRLWENSPVTNTHCTNTNTPLPSFSSASASASASASFSFFTITTSFLHLLPPYPFHDRGIAHFDCNIAHSSGNCAHNTNKGWIYTLDRHD